MAKKRDPRQRIDAELRKYALTYPETKEDRPWGEHAIKVKGKTFLFASFFDDVLRFTVKLPVSSEIAVGLPFAAPSGYGLGKHGWVTTEFREGDDVPVAMLKGWIDESFRAVAPKKVLAMLDDGDPRED